MNFLALHIRAVKRRLKHRRIEFISRRETSQVSFLMKIESICYRSRNLKRQSDYRFRKFKTTIVDDYIIDSIQQIDRLMKWKNICRNRQRSVFSSSFQVEIVNSSEQESHWNMPRMIFWWIDSIDRRKFLITLISSSSNSHLNDKKKMQVYDFDGITVINGIDCRHIFIVDETNKMSA